MGAICIEHAQNVMKENQSKTTSTREEKYALSARMNISIHFALRSKDKKKSENA